MGYEIYFKPTQEAVDQKLKVYKSCGEKLEDNLAQYKLELTLLIMKDLDNKNIHSIIAEIRVYLNIIKQTILDIQKEYVKKEYETSEDHSFYFCGHQYECDSYHIECNSNDVLKELVIMAALVKTEDYFAEGSKFYTKLDKVESLIDNFVDDCWSDATWQIIKDFKAFEVTYDDNDNTDDYSGVDSSIE
jgi:hypothetical protein